MAGSRAERPGQQRVRRAVFQVLVATFAIVYSAPLAMVQPGTRAWNFAFGSNMDVFTRRRRQLEPSRIAPGVAQGWELCFSLPGIPYIEPAFAALRPSSNVSTHGVCLELDKESWLRLLVSEGVFRPDEMERIQTNSLQEVLELAARPEATFGYRLLPLEAGMGVTSLDASVVVGVMTLFWGPHQSRRLPSGRSVPHLDCLLVSRLGGRNFRDAG